MKTFIVINGKNSYLIQGWEILSIRQKAINFCDHSHEIIVREIDSLLKIQAL